MMSTKKYRIRLTTDEQQELNALVSRGRAAAYKQTHARILLMSDESRSDGGMKDADITSALGVGQSTVERIRKRCVEEGVESALNRKKQLRRRPQIPHLDKRKTLLEPDAMRARCFVVRTNHHQRGAPIMKQGLLAFQYEEEKSTTGMTALSG